MSINISQQRRIQEHSGIAGVLERHLLYKTM
jgi:hypothetical protein